MINYKDILNHKLLSSSEEQYLIGKAHNGCSQSRERLILLNMRLVHWVCSKYATETVSPEDLFGDGVQGLIRAVDRFDLTLGTRLSTYATLAIHHAVGRSALLDTTIRLPQRVAKSIRLIRKALTDLACEGKINPSNEELAANIDDIKSEEVAKLRLLMDTILNVVSLDAPIQEDGDKELSLADVLEYDRSVYENLLDEVDLDFFLDKLQDHEKIVLTRSYGIPRKMTNIEIAEVIGTHRNKITAIRREALAKCQRIAQHLKSNGGLSKNETWSYIMADPIESPQMNLFT